MVKFSNSFESGKIRLKVLTNNFTSLTNLTKAKFKKKRMHIERIFVKD